jgi:IMP cyclohydrolase
MDFLAQLRYPGRFIILGKDGEDFVAIYGATGRSSSSLDRRYIQEGNEILAVQLAEGGNAELLTYPAFRFLENGIIVANGRQIEKVSKNSVPSTAQQLLNDLGEETYEPDENKTPRITGAYFENGSHVQAGLHIVRATGTNSKEGAWEVPLVSGEGKYIATYGGEDLHPAPSFKGKPFCVTLSYGSPENAAQSIFAALSPQTGERDYRVGVIACYKKLGEKPRVVIKNAKD